MPYRTDARLQDRVAELERLHRAARAYVNAASSDPGFPQRLYFEMVRVLDELYRQDHQDDR